MNLVDALGLGTPWRVRELQRLDQQVRASRPVAVRVGVVGVARGIGASVAAGMAASVLAARGHRVLAVNSSGPGPSLLWHVGQPPQQASTPEEDELRRAATTFADVANGLPHAASGVYCLELADSQLARWQHAVAPVARFFDYTITDWGPRTGVDLATVAAASTLVAVVTPADRPAVQEAVDLADAAHLAGATPVVVITDPANTWSPAWRELLGLLPFSSTHVAYDKAHGADRPQSSRRLPAATRLSGLRVAATIVNTTSTTPTEAVPGDAS